MKEQEEQFFTKKIVSVQNDKDAFTLAERYEEGRKARQEGNVIKATEYFWQALICGEGRAAYPLFEMLRDGEGVIPQNMEMAGMFLFVGRKSGDIRCIETLNLKEMPFDAARAVFSVCADSRKYIVNQGYKITDEIIDERREAANKVLDNFYMKTRAHQQPMLDVLQHPVVVLEELVNDVYLAGQDEVYTGCGFCCI